MLHLERGDGVKLAFEFADGEGPLVVFLPGFASDMNGTKAIIIHEYCQKRGQATLRLDYSGHGASGGRFEDGCISLWTADAAAVIDAVAGDRPLVLAGSSMGGWIALLLGLRSAGRLAGMLLIAPATDFTEALLWSQMGEAQRAQLIAEGFLLPPSDYGPPVPLTLKLIEDGRQHLLLEQEIALDCPVRILHGMADKAVPWTHSLKLAAQLRSQDVRLVFVKNGDHRLSKQQDLQLLLETLSDLLGQNTA